MKKIMISLSAIILFSGLSVSAQFVQQYGQCNRSTSTPIQVQLLQRRLSGWLERRSTNRNSDYKRYRDKYERKYEDFFRDGYNAGYDSIRPTTRWTNSQRKCVRLGLLDRAKR